MGVRVNGKVKMVNMGMAGTRINKKNTVKISNSNFTFCTRRQPGHTLDRIITRLAANRLH